MTNMRKNENPFIYNYVFVEDDLRRLSIKLSVKLTLIERFFLFFWPTYVQFSDNYVWHYKQRNNKYYLMKVEKIPEIPMPK